MRPQQDVSGKFIIFPDKTRHHRSTYQVPLSKERFVEECDLVDSICFYGLDLSTCIILTINVSVVLVMGLQLDPLIWRMLIDRMMSLCSSWFTNEQEQSMW